MPFWYAVFRSVEHFPGMRYAVWGFWGAFLGITHALLVGMKLSDELIGYLQHGTAPDPCRTESVRVHHEYGDRYQAWFEGRWRRVYISVKRMFILYRGEGITIQIEGV